jgi:hypothetical protein
MRRGFFRLWILVSILYAILVALSQFDTIQAEFRKAAAVNNARERIAAMAFNVPIPCELARGTIGIDFTTSPADTPNRFEKYKVQEPNSFCYYSLPKIRLLYPEYNDMADGVLQEKLTTLRRENSNSGLDINPWAHVASLLAWIVSVPVILLLLGLGIGWVWNGFRRQG